MNTLPQLSLPIIFATIGAAITICMIRRAVTLVRKMREGIVKTPTRALRIGEHPAAALAYLLIDTLIITLFALIGMAAALWGSAGVIDWIRQ